MPNVRLGDVLEVQSGFAFKKEDFTLDTGIPLIRIRDLPNLSTEINYRGDFREEFVVEQGDYLIGMDGNFRCHRWQGPRGLLNQRVCRLRNFKEVIEPEYVYYGIQEKLHEIEGATSFVTVKHLSAKQVQNIELPLLPLYEQRRIVDILSRAEGIVRLRREAEKKAAELIPGIFLEMFGDPATNQRGWPRDQLGGLLSNIDSGISPRCHDRKKTNGEWGVLRLSALTGGEYNEAEHKTLPEEIEATPSIEVKAGDVLVSRKNTYELVGTCSYVWETVGHMLLPDLIFRLKIRDAQKLHPIYLWVLLGLPAKRSQIKQLASGSAGSMPNISKQRLMTLPVELPPIGHQVCFSEAVAQIRGIRIQQAAATAKAQATFDALLAQAFSDSSI